MKMNLNFYWNNAEYKQNEKGNRYYKVVDGKTTRIGKDEFFHAMGCYSNEWEQEADKEAADREAKQERDAEEAEKKVRKPRRSKDIAFEHEKSGITLTAKQVDFIKHLPDTCFWEHGLDSTPWTDVLCDEIGGQFAGKPMTVGAIISTLCEKEIAYRAKDRINNRTCTYMGLTEIGKEIAKELGLE